MEAKFVAEKGGKNHKPHWNSLIPIGLEVFEFPSRLPFCARNEERKTALPRAKSTSPFATATAEPLEEPPGWRPGAAGFVGVPKCSFWPRILQQRRKKSTNRDLFPNLVKT